MTRYSTNGVLTGLHYQKAGQYRSLERVTCVSLALLVVVIITCVVRMGDGVLTPDEVDRINYPPRFSGPLSGPASSPPHFVQGHLRKARIVRDHGSVFTPKLPECVRDTFSLSTHPGVFQSVGSGEYPPGPLSFDPDFDLPDPPPLWRFTYGRLPTGIVDQNISLPVKTRHSHAMLINLTWPSDVWLVEDTAIVEGYLTLHAYGLLSFELLSETHPRLGFGAAVQTAVNRGVCVPGVDGFGNRITVRCRYRCLFFHGGQASVSVDGSITARIRED